MNMQTSTLKFDESGQPLHLQQAEQIEAFREAWRTAGHAREPRVSVSRSIFPLVDDRDRAYFGHGQQEATRSATWTKRPAPSSAAPMPPSQTYWSSSWRQDTAISAADTLLLTIPNQLGVDYNAHVIESVLRHVAPALGWR